MPESFDKGSILTRHSRTRRELNQAKRKIQEQEQQIEGFKRLIENMKSGSENPGISPENVIWVFGSGRTGSSWMTFIMATLPDHSRWNEPLIGYMFANTYFNRGKRRQDTSHFILGDHHRREWMNSVRSFLLDGANARFPARADGGYLVIKEPHGSSGAPLLMEALPESRMIFLVRDPRDVIASKLAAHKPGSWAGQNLGIGTMTQNRVVEFASQSYLTDIQRSYEAYSQHTGYKSMIRYEDLRWDTLDNMMRIYADLGIEVDRERMNYAVERRSWDKIPDEQKGDNKIRRKAKPGSYGEDLKPEEISIVEKECAWILEEFYGS